MIGHSSFVELLEHMKSPVCSESRKEKMTKSILIFQMERLKLTRVTQMASNQKWEPHPV